MKKYGCLLLLTGLFISPIVGTATQSDINEFENTSKYELVDISLPNIPSLDWTYKNHFSFENWQKNPDTKVNGKISGRKIENDKYNFEIKYQITDISTIQGDTKSYAGLSKIKFNTATATDVSEAIIQDTNGRSWTREAKLTSDGNITIEPGELLGSEHYLIKSVPFLLNSYGSGYPFFNDTHETTGLSISFKFNADPNNVAFGITNFPIKVAPEVLKVSYKNIKTGSDILPEDILGFEGSYNDMIKSNAKVIPNFKYVGKNKIVSEDYNSDPIIPKNVESVDNFDTHMLDNTRTHIIYWYDAETTQPTEETTPPVEETVPPTEETTPPVEETVPPTEETTPPVEETVPPTEETTPPVKETVPPTEGTKASESSKEPSKETSKNKETLPQTGEQSLAWASLVGTTLLSVVGYIFYKRKG
ncbi:LPXTG cell wall anchor domain-containing protein [Enterococcus faecalis]|nr:LPXTG cell wall anchor domain-containing protein [Enterococcus faecalis]